MINYVKGDLLSAQTQALVNTVNTVGVMGKGIALQFKERYPNNLAQYIYACKSGELVTGKMLVVKEQTLDQEPKIIINFPTKQNWRNKSKYEYIDEGLKDLVKVIRQYNIKSIAIPPLGCGNGGLNWNTVKDLMEKYLLPLNDIDIYIFQPNDEIKAILKKESRNENPQLTPARALLLYSMIYVELSGDNASLFIANKLAYFFQRLGEPSFKNLKFTGHRYGPYSAQISHLIHTLNGKYLKGMEQMQLKAFEPFELQYDRVNEISEYVRKNLDNCQILRLKKLLNLIKGFESTLSLELLASVDFIRKEYPGISKEETIRKVQNWSDRKKDLFKNEYICIAYDHLEKYSTEYQYFS